ncbi:MAG: thioredoxin-disulfide reductase [Chloroflexota bacterium]
MKNKYDVVIIGGGPAGLTAGIYTSRDRLKSLIIDKGIIGGNINNAESIDNYPGFPDGVSGSELAELMHRQAKKYGMESMIAEVTAIDIEGENKVIKTTSGNFISRAVIIAGGSEKVKLGIPGEKEFTGKGVSYCSTCDAFFFRDKKVAVVGGGNSAIYEALHLTKFASNISVIHRRDRLRATAILQERASAEAKIDFILSTTVKAIEGKDFVQKMLLENVKTGEQSTIEIDGVFISIGLKPSTGFLKDLLPLDKQGHIITDWYMSTKIAGIFAAGDIRSGSIRQVTTAAGDGTVAAISAKKFIDGE